MTTAVILHLKSWFGEKHTALVYVNNVTDLETLKTLHQSKDGWKYRLESDYFDESCLDERSKIITDIVIPTKAELKVLQKYLGKEFITLASDNMREFKYALADALKDKRIDNYDSESTENSDSESTEDKNIFDEVNEDSIYEDQKTIDASNLPFKDTFNKYDLIEAMNTLDYVLLNDSCIVPGNTLADDEEIEDIYESQYFLNMFFCPEEYRRGAKLSKVFQVMGYKTLYLPYMGNMHPEDTVKVEDDNYKVVLSKRIF